MSFGRAFTFAQMRRAGSLQGEALHRYQVKRLRAMLMHAHAHVPYWKRMLDSAGVVPTAVDSVEDLQRLPVTRREDLQRAHGLLAENVDPADCVVRRTGGSTGRPLTIRTLRDDLEVEALGWLRTWQRFGLSLRDRQAALKEPEDVHHQGSSRWFHRLGFLRVQHLDLYSPAERLVDQLNSISPDVLRGPPSTLDALAREIEAREAPSAIRPRLVFTTGERLDARARARAGLAFESPLHDLYGATEAGCLAWQEPHSRRYTVNSDLVIVEILENGRPVAPGEAGEVVITNLFSKAMPFVRYALGDRARRSLADHEGPDVRVLEELLGRTVDQVVLRDGRIVSPYHFMPDEVKGIDTYRITQTRPDEIQLLVVPGRGFAEEDLKRACAEYESDLGGACQVSYRLLRSLPAETAEGQRRVVRTETPTGF